MARAAAVVLVVALAAFVLLQGSALQGASMAVVLVALLALRALWRCPNCSVPPSIWPWKHGTRCRACHSVWLDSDADSAD